MKSNANVRETFPCASCRAPTLRICPTCALLQQTTALQQAEARVRHAPSHHGLSIAVIHLHCLRCNMAINPECNQCRATPKRHRQSRSTSTSSSSLSSVRSPTECNKDVADRLSQQETMPATFNAPMQSTEAYKPVFNHQNLTKTLNARPRSHP